MCGCDVERASVVIVVEIDVGISGPSIFPLQVAYSLTERPRFRPRDSEAQSHPGFERPAIEDMPRAALPPQQSMCHTLLTLLPMYV